MKYFYVLICSLLLFLFGCNNWNENPVDTKEELKTDSAFVPIEKVNYPAKTNKIYFLSDQSIIVTSSDGKFYLSENGGESWQATGEMTSPQTVNCLYKFLDGTTKKEFIYAGTEDGLYVSGDAGKTWKQSLGNDGSGNHLQVYCFDISKNVSTNTDTLFAYGLRGQNNYFYTVDNGNNWGEGVLLKMPGGKIKAKADFSYNIGTIAVCRNIVYAIYYESKMRFHQFQTTTYSSYGGASPTIESKVSLPGVNDITTMFVIKSNLLVASDYGIFRLNGLQWNPTGMLNEKVNSMSLENGYLFATTDDWAFISVSDGMGWSSINIGYKQNKFQEIYLRKGYLLCVSAGGEVFRLKFESPESITKDYFSPILLSPKSGATGVSENVTLSWNDWKRDNYIVYAIELSTDPSFTDNSTVVYDYIFKTSVECKGLKSKTKYYWRLYKYDLYTKIWNGDVNSFETR